MNSGEKHLKYRIKNKIKIKKRFIVASIAVMVCLVTAIVVTNMNTHKTEAGVAIGSSNVISIRTSGSGDLDNFGLAYPILYITLDETGVGLPADFDYDSSKWDYNISQILKDPKNSYGGYLPALEDSSICFVPYAANDYLARQHFTSGRTKNDIRSSARMLWSKGIGSGELHEEHGSSKAIIKTINAMNATPGSSETLLGKDLSDGIFYDDIVKLDNAGKLENWKSLISGKVGKSIHLWNYITDYSGREFDVTGRINAYIHSADAEDKTERAYRYLDLLMTCYAMSYGSSAANSWKTGINNYITSKNTDANGAPLGANIIVHTGAMYDNNRAIYFITHMDAINFTMGMTANGDMTNKAIANKLQQLELSKSAGLVTSGSYQFNLRLREAYGASYKAAPSATRTAWSGPKTYYGSTLVNFILDKRPKQKDWKTLQDRENPYIKALYLPLVVSGAKTKSSYGLNAVLAEPWGPKPSLSMTASVKWADKEERKLTIPDAQANINDLAAMDLKFTTKNIAIWEGLATQYKKSAVMINVKRHTVDNHTTNKEFAKSNINGLTLGKYNSAKEVKSAELKTYYKYGTADDFIKLLKDKSIPMSMFVDNSTMDQPINNTETIAFGYDISVKVMLYNGTVSSPSSKWVYGTDDKNENGTYLDYKYSELKSASKKSKLVVEASKGVEPIPDTIHEDPVDQDPAYEYVDYTSEPQAYAELKEGTVNINGTNSIENYEAMAGVPSTEKLYFTSGGSEFIAEIHMQKIEDEGSERQYISYFNTNSSGCEFKPGDTLKGGSGKYSLSETFVADSDGNKQNKSVTAEKSNIATPSGNSSGNITINGHNSSSTIWAEWTGTIGNSTSEPSDIGKFDPGKPGSPCQGIGYNVGTQRQKADPKTNWSVSSYNAALNQAIQMESTNSSFTVQRIADSDGQIRQWVIGNAVIQVTMSGGSNGHSHTQGPGFSKNGSYSSSSASGATVKNDDRSVLGSGWGWSDGKLATGGTSGCCAHGGKPHKEWDVVPKPAVSPTYDEEGNMTSPGSPEVVGVKHAYNHSCWFNPGTDLTQGASSTINYTIKVTFKNSKTQSGGNYDGDKLLGESSHTSNGVLGAHALCGPCCQHNTLPAVYDKWNQKLKYDYMRINAVNVYKISRSYVGGMEVITFDEDENVSANINRGDPNIFYNIAEESSTYSTENPEKPSLAGRIRYSLQSQQHDIVTWRERSTAGDKRTNKCDGMAKTVSGNAVPSGGNGHSNQKWANGMLYNNSVPSYDEEWFDNIATKTDKSGYTNNSADAVDEKTEEYKRFAKRRTTDNTAVIVSDMLILQTSTGDQSVMYFTKKQKATAQEHYGEDGELDASTSEMWYNNGLSAGRWKPTSINIGGYTGEYSTPNKKFSTGSGSIATIFDNDGSDYDVSIGHPDPDATVAGPLTYKTVANAVNTLDADSYKSSPAKLQRRMNRVSLLKIVKDGIVQDPTNPNAEYETGDAMQFYTNILKYTRGHLEDSNRRPYDFEYTDETDDVLGLNGYSEVARYSPSHTKINNIVVHDPVSVQNASIVALDPSRD